MPVDASGHGPQAVPYSPRRAAANRAMFPLPSSSSAAAAGPTLSRMVSGLWFRLVLVPASHARRFLFGSGGRARHRAGSGGGSGADKLV